MHCIKILSAIFLQFSLTAEGEELSVYTSSKILASFKTSAKSKNPEQLNTLEGSRFLGSAICHFTVGLFTLLRTGDPSEYKLVKISLTHNPDTRYTK